MANTRRTAPSFAAFLTQIEARFGAPSLAVRHEIYFSATRSGLWRSKTIQMLHACAALLRTVIQLYLPRRRVPIPVGTGPVAVVSLAGGNGWGTLAPALASLPHPMPAIAHPRLRWRGRPDGGALLTLPRPPRAAWSVAWPLVRSALRAPPPAPERPLSRILVAGSLLRGALWRGAWQRAVAEGLRGPLLLHNDFDMMSAAALDCGLPTICLQHGIPTDEFFPVRAQHHVVWGHSSAQAYAASGVAPERIRLDGLGRAEQLAPPPTQPPSGLVLLSQTHSGIYGASLGRRLCNLARGLAAEAAALNIGFEIWLHPQERTFQLIYGHELAFYLRRPPHARLGQVGSQGPLMMIGFCSTALLDAAAAGHWVVGLDWQLTGSTAAQRVGRPPLRIGDAAALRTLFTALQENADSRIRIAVALDHWRRTALAPQGALGQLLESISSKDSIK